MDSFEHSFLVEKNMRKSEGKDEREHTDTTETTLQKKNKKETYQYDIETINDLEDYIFKLTEKLKENIDNDEYDTLIGDDASGRIPTLVLREIINRRREEMHPGEKVGGIVTKFIAGGRGYSWDEKKRENLKPVLEKIKKDIHRKALVVTEHMRHSGIAKMAEALDEAEINFDLAILSSFLPKEKHIKDNPILETKKIYVGKEDGSTPDIYARSSFSGVKKEYPDVPLASRNKYANQNDINEVRREVKMLAEKTIRNIWGTSKESSQ